MKKFKIIVFIAFFTCFIPSVKSEQFVTVKTAPSYSTNFKITGEYQSSGWTTLNGGDSHEFDLEEIGIEEGDTYTVNYEVEAGGRGHCGSYNMTRGADVTTDYYTMQNTISNASCVSGRRYH